MEGKDPSVNRVHAGTSGAGRELERLAGTTAGAATGPTDLTGQQYNPHTAWRTPARLHPCGLHGTDTACVGREYGRPHAPGMATVWDHCHTHGTIRGPLCGVHNGDMRRMDRIAGGDPRPARRPVPDALISWLLRCPGCCRSDFDQERPAPPPPSPPITARSMRRPGR